MVRIGKFQIESAAVSDIGQQRRNNEDALLAMDQHAVYCIADGVGGSERSELASQSIVREIQAAFDSQSSTAVDTSKRDPETVARTAINQASKWIHERAGHLETAGMASTVIVLIFHPAHPEQALTLHAGDSRCYRFRDGTLELMTRDHSGAEMIGIRDERMVPEHYRNLITRAVGTHPRVDLEHTLIDVDEGDLLLLCSDGLNRMVPDHQLGEIMSKGSQVHLQALVRELVQSANDAGGMDNISVILVRVATAGPKEASS